MLVYGRHAHHRWLFYFCANKIESQIYNGINLLISASCLVRLLASEMKRNITFFCVSSSRSPSHAPCHRRRRRRRRRHVSVASHRLLFNAAVLLSRLPSSPQTPPTSLPREQQTTSFAYDVIWILIKFNHFGKMSRSHSFDRTLAYSHYTYICMCASQTTKQISFE